uniref:Uncharacterized protein n=1 Tax=Romanomermis culicivorax TaxID=13658 RepID=A0A915I589_ROMCU
MSTEQNTPETSRPKRRASLQSVSMIKHFVALSSVNRRKRKAAVVDDSQEISKKESKRSTSPVEAKFSLAELNDTLFPTDNGLEYRLGARLRAQDEFGKYTAKIIEINPENGEMLIHFDYWSQRYDEWIPANSDRLIPLDNAVETRPLQVGDFVFAKWGETGTYPAQIVEFLESDRYKLLYYDGFEKVAHRRNLKKMTDEEVKQLDLVNFGRLKILPTYPNVMFDPNLAGKLHDLGSRRRSSKNGSLGSSAVDSPKCDTPLSATEDGRVTPKIESSEDNDDGQVVDKATMKPLPKRKSLNLRSVDKNSSENSKKALSKSKSIVEAAKKFCNKKQTISTSNSSLDLQPNSDSSPSKNSEDSRTLSNIREQQLDELPLQNFVSKTDVSLVEHELFGDFAAKACPARLVQFTQEDDEKMCEFIYELLEDNQISSARPPFSESVWSKFHARGLLLNHSSKSLGKHMRRIFLKFNDFRNCLRPPVAKKLSETYKKWIGSVDDSGIRPSARYGTRRLSAKSTQSADQSLTKEENVTTPIRESSQDLTGSLSNLKNVKMT